MIVMKKWKRMASQLMKVMIQKIDLLFLIFLKKDLLKYEQDVAREFDASLFVSADEAALFRQLAPDASERVGYLDNGVDHAYFTPESDYEDPYDGCRAVIVFTGAMDYWANIDAVTWFSREVFPAVRESVNTARFVIVGARPSDEVRSLASIPGISVTGAVKDIRPYLSHARVAVAPMRVARGVQNKVLEAMAMGKFVVASNIGGHRELIQHGETGALFDIDDQDKLAANICDALDLARSNEQLGNNARAFVSEQRDWSKSAAKYLPVYESLLRQ